MTSIKLCFEWFLVIFALTHVSATEVFQPCRINDDACITKSAKAALPIIFSGIPELGVTSSDPLYIEEIKGDLSIMKYTLTDNTITGLKNCDIDNLKLSLEEMSLRFNLTCTNFKSEGNYVIGGRLIVLPVEGNGTYSIFCKKYLIGMDTKVKKVMGSDGSEHLQIKKFTLSVKPEEEILFDFQNLFNGRKDLADAVLKFANENWREVANFVQGPVLNTDFRKIVNNVNKYLKTVPMEKLFIQ